MLTHSIKHQYLLVLSLTYDHHPLTSEQKKTEKENNLHSTPNVRLYFVVGPHNVHKEQLA